MKICSMPWVGMAINVKGKIAPCCRYQPQITNKPNNFSLTFEGDLYKYIRKTMLEGKVPEGCRDCYAREKAIGTSMMSELTDAHPVDNYDTPVLKYLEIGFGNTCNMACIMCDEMSSSKWQLIKFPKQKVIPSDLIEVDWFNTKLSSLELIKILGGEPFLNRDAHNKFLSRLSELTNTSKISLKYHSNATVPWDDTLLDIWSKYKSINVYLSIDGYGKINELQRPGPSWETIEKNVAKYIYTKTTESRKDGGVAINLGVHTVITKVNVWHLEELLKWKKNFLGDETYHAFEVVQGQPQLAVSSLTDKEKKNLTKKLKSPGIPKHLRDLVVTYF